MPLQNRVTPMGDIIADAARGTLMGNRGILHDASEAARRSALATSQLDMLPASFKNRRRRVMAPGRYTELFFLDEATALAAGHRPCCECRRDEFRAFQAAWRRAADTPDASAGAIDRVLHEARVDPRTRRQIRFEVPLGDLPDGVFVLLPAGPSRPSWSWATTCCRGNRRAMARRAPDHLAPVASCSRPGRRWLSCAPATPRRSTRRPFADSRVESYLTIHSRAQLVSAVRLAPQTRQIRRCCARRRCPWRGTSGGGDGAARRRTAPGAARAPARGRRRRRRSSSAGARCAPPSGSGMIWSTTPSSCRSWAVSRIASAAAGACSPLRHRIAAQPSGEITEYTACSSISTRSATASATAPPEPPSPMIAPTSGTAICRQVSIARAIASAWPRSSAPIPG